MAVTLLAKNFIDADGVIVKSGENIARAVVSALGNNESVLISLDEMASISSSYFNVIFKAALQKFGSESLTQIKLQTASDLTQQIFDRSREACRRLSA